MKTATLVRSVGLTITLSGIVLLVLAGAGLSPNAQAQTVIENNTVTNGTVVLGTGVGSGTAMSFPISGTFIFNGNTVNSNSAGLNGSALRVGNGAIVSGHDNLLSTIANNAHALYVLGTGEADFAGGSLSTAGEWAYGALARNGGSITLTDVLITTAGDRGFGLEAEGGGQITATDVEITTSGWGAHAVQAFDTVSGAVNQIQLSGGSITTNGENSYGLLARGGGLITADGVSITTNHSGASGYGAYVWNGSTITLTGGTSITTQGAGSAGAVVTDGTLIIENTTINAQNAPALLLRNQGEVTITDGTLISGTASVMVLFDSAGFGGSPPPGGTAIPGEINITLGNGTVATNNNGALLQVDRAENDVAASEGVVHLTLAAGSVSSGDIIDLNAGGGGTDVLIEQGAQWSGLTFGVRNLISQQEGAVEFQDGSQIGGDLSGSGSNYSFGQGVTIGGNVNMGNQSRVSGGTINNPVQVGGNVVVDQTSFFGGNWNIGGNLNSSGTLSPGNSFGVVTIAGDLTLDGTSVYDVEIGAAAQSDLIQVGGTAFLDGTVAVTPLNGLTINTPYTILTAGNGITGAFDAVTLTTPSIFLTPELTYNPTSTVLLTLIQTTTFESVGGTPNQRAVAGVLDGLAGTGNLDDILGDLFLLTAAGVQQAFDSLSGVQHTHGQQLGLNAGRQFQSLLFGRLGGDSLFLADSGGVSLAFTGEHWAHELDQSLHGRNAGGSTSRERGLWLRGFGGFGDIDDDANASGADYQYGGIAVGADVELNADTVAGLAFGYTRSDADTFGGQLDVDSYQAAVYAGWQQSDYYLNGAVSGGYHQLDAQRQVVAGGFNEQARADYDSFHIGAGVEGGKDFALTSQTIVTPFVGLDYTHLNRDSFTETGAGAANLTVNKETQDSLRTRVGARLSHTFQSDGGMRLTPTIEAAYVREHLDRNSRITAGFAAAPAATFQIAGPKLDRNRAQVGAGLTAQLSERSSLNVNYQGEIAGSDDHHTFSATFRMKW